MAKQLQSGLVLHSSQDVTMRPSPESDDPLFLSLLQRIKASRSNNIYLANDESHSRIMLC